MDPQLISLLSDLQVDIAVVREVVTHLKESQDKCQNRCEVIDVALTTRVVALENWRSLATGIFYFCTSVGAVGSLISAFVFLTTGASLK